ncbi:MAG: DUF5060 domain-containing protein [Armatimonadota bacterium]|jgi:hypothetical protein
MARFAIPAVLVPLACLMSSAGQSADLGPKTTRMWDCAEWRLTNPSYPGNPFDLIAKATFIHKGTDRRHVTEMFYVGDKGWSFRFTGTATGQWSFTTSSDDPDLDGHAGEVSVLPNDDPTIKGFLTHRGSRYAIRTGNDGRLEGYLFNVYMNQQDFAMQHRQDKPGPIEDRERVDDYFSDARETGFDVVFYFLTHHVFRLGAVQAHEHDSVNPDLRTFANLDYIVRYSHQRGGRVHFWCWGDAARRQTPARLPGGINGPVDRRLQRYIAARLGPLPGWSMGYGYDLHEWTTAEQVRAWADYLHGHMGWQHLLSARGQVLDGPGNISSYDGFGRDVPLHTTRHGPADYGEIAEDLEGDTARPHLYEERHTYQRDGFDLDMDGSRRLIWRLAMAGGMGGFFGYYSQWFNRWGPFKGKYPNPEQFRTHRAFWRGRFLLDMERRNDLTDGHCLASPGSEHYVFYREQASSIWMDLSSALRPLPAVAIDTRAEYEKIALGALQATPQTWNAPRESDWAVAVGVHATGRSERP